MYYCVLYHNEYAPNQSAQDMFESITGNEILKEGWISCSEKGFDTMYKYASGKIQLNKISEKYGIITYDLFLYLGMSDWSDPVHID